MFRIGDFSRLTQVSIKTLHHYDEIGLFKPKWVDKQSDYRYYTAEQLPRLNRIIALKGLGFSLEQIRQVLDEGLSAEALQGMLQLRQAQLQQQMAETREMLAQVEIRLHQIQKEGTMSDIEILTKQVEAMTVVGAREVVPTAEQMRERCMALEAEARRLIAREKLKANPINFALYYPCEEGIDVEMAYVIERPSHLSLAQVAANIHELPAVTVAYAVYKGSYDDFGAVGQLHMALNQWLDENGYQVSGPSREFYLQVPHGRDRNGVMEIQYPIA